MVKQLTPWTLCWCIFNKHIKMYLLMFFFFFFIKKTSISLMEQQWPSLVYIIYDFTSLPYLFCFKGLVLPSSNVNELEGNCCLLWVDFCLLQCSVYIIFISFFWRNILVCNYFLNFDAISFCFFNWKFNVLLEKIYLCLVVCLNNLAHKQVYCIFDF